MSKRRIVTWILAVGGAAVVAIAAAVVIQGVRSDDRAIEASIAPTPTPSPTPTAATSCTVLGAAVGESFATLTVPTTDDEFDSWTWWRSSPGSSYLTSATEDRRSGLAAVRVAPKATSAGSGLEVLQQNVAVQPGSQYVLSFVAKAETEELSGVSVAIAAASGALRADVDPGVDWTRYEIPYTAGESDSSIWIDIELASASGPVQFDEFSLIRAVDSADAAQVLKVQSRIAGDAEVAACIRDDEGRVVASETVSLGAGGAEIPVVGSAGNIYTATFTVRFDGTEVERSVQYGVGLTSLEGEKSDSFFGLSGHILGTEQRLATYAETLQSLGIREVRVEMIWDQIETTRSSYTYPPRIENFVTAMNDHGIGVLMVPAYKNDFYDDGRTPSSPSGIAAYAAFAADLARHFNSDLNSIEVYNEFDHIHNTGRCGTTAGCYMELLSATAKAVEAAAPGTRVAGPGIAGMKIRDDWLGDFAALGGVDMVDALSFHPYTQPEPADDLYAGLVSITKDLRYGDVPVWLTEMGWSAATDWVTDENQAAFLVRMAAQSRAASVERLYWFTLADLTTDETSRELNFGLLHYPTSVTPDTYQPKVSALAQRASATLLGDARLVEDRSEGDLTWYVFSKSDGTKTHVLWRATSEGGPVDTGAEDGVGFEFTGRVIEDFDPSNVLVAELPIFVHVGE